SGDTATRRRAESCSSVVGVTVRLPPGSPAGCRGRSIYREYRLLHPGTGAARSVEECVVTVPRQLLHPRLRGGAAGDVEACQQGDGEDYVKGDHRPCWS